MELSWGGERPVVLRDGTERAWLEDGDTATISARMFPGGDGDGSAETEESTLLGEVTGTILAAELDSWTRSKQCRSTCEKETFHIRGTRSIWGRPGAFLKS
jgi:hypothetical protein